MTFEEYIGKNYLMFEMDEDYDETEKVFSILDMKKLWEVYQDDRCRLIQNKKEMRHKIIDVEKEIRTRDNILKHTKEIMDEMYEKLPCDAKFSPDCTPCSYSDYIAKSGIKGILDEN